TSKSRTRHAEVPNSPNVSLGGGLTASESGETASGGRSTETRGGSRSSITGGGSLLDTEAGRMALGKISPESAPEPDPDFDSDDMGTSAPRAPSPSSPSNRHMDSHLHQRLGDIRIQISGVQPIDPATLQYQIS